MFAAYYYNCLSQGGSANFKDGEICTFNQRYSGIQLRISQMSSNKSSKIVFILTNLAFQAVIGQIGVYSICKAPMAQTFHYDEAFLGILQAVTLIGEIIGSFSILFMPVNPVTGFLMFAILNAVVGILLFIPRHVASTELQNFIVIFVLFVQTFCLASLAFAQITFNQYYKQNSKKYQHSIWFSLTFLGDIFSVLLTQYAIYKFGIQWEWTKMIWALFIFLIALLMYIYLDDHSEGHIQIEEMLSIDSKEIQNHDGHTVEKKFTKTQECCMLFTRTWNELKKLNILLVTLSFGLIEGIYSNLLFWAPYYYIEMNEEAYSMASILGCCLSITVGGILFQLILFELLQLQRHSKTIAYILLLVSGIAYSTLWGKRNGDPKLQIILLCVSNFLIACPYNRISIVDPAEQANNEPHRVKTVFLLIHLSRTIFIAASTIVIGFLMKQQAGYFWHVIIINVGLAVLVETIRKVCMRNPETDIVKAIKDNS